mgnify:CR=1 FL=1
MFPYRNQKGNPTKTVSLQKYEDPPWQDLG